MSAVAVLQTAGYKGFQLYIANSFKIILDNFCREFANLNDEQVAEVVAQASHFVARVARLLVEQKERCA